MKTILFACSLTLITLPLFAQNYSFGKAGLADIKYERKTGQESASAAYLYDHRETYFDYMDGVGWMIVTNVHQRLKIYDKDGLDWATLHLSLYKGDQDAEKISGVKGFTYTDEGGQIEKTKLKKEGIFTENMDKYRDRMVVTMPNVKVGSVVEWEYSRRSPFWTIDELKIQRDIPVEKIDATVRVPEYFMYNQFQRGYLPVELKKKTKRRSMTIRWRELKQGSSNLTQAQSGNIEFQENVYYISSEHIPAIVPEAYVSNLDNYKTAVVFELAQYRPPNAPYRNFSTSWHDVAKTIHDLPSFGGELAKTNYFKEELGQVVSEVSDPLQRLVAIYELVKARMTWNEYHGVLCDQGVRKAWKEQSGNIAEINLIVTAMLREAGINAYPVLASTRSNGIPLFPTRSGFNYVLSAAKIGEDFFLLDASEKFGAPNLLPNRVINWTGRLIRENGTSEEIRLTPSAPSEETYFVQGALQPDNQFAGTLEVRYAGNLALEKRKHIVPNDLDDYTAEVQNDLGVDITAHEISASRETLKPLSEKITFTMENAAEELGEKVYLNPMLFLGIEENPFKLEERHYPVDFTYPRKKRCIINVTLPDNYAVEALPESSALKLPDGLGAYQYRLSQNGNAIQLICTLELTQPIVTAQYYDVLKQLFAQMVELETDQIVLAKV